MPDMNLSTPLDIMRVITLVERELAAGLNLGDGSAVVALAKQIERDLVPRIIPDRRYTIPELVNQFGYTRGLLYKRHKHLIRKDGRKSFVWGRELLADIEAAPTLGARAIGNTVAPRRRGRPRKLESERRPAAQNAAQELTAA